MGTPANLRDRLREPGTPAPERIPGCRESHLEIQAAAADQSVAGEPGRDRETAWPQGSARFSLCCQTGHDSRLVAASDCTEVRRLQTSPISWTSGDRQGDRAWSSEWRKKTPVGGTIGSLAPSPT